MKISDLKIGDQFKTFCDMDNKTLENCVYVGMKVIPHSKISESKKVHCFISYDNGIVHSMYVNASHEVEKTSFKQLSKSQFDINTSCSPYEQYKLITECDGVYIAHNSPEQLRNYKIKHFNVRDVNIHNLDDSVKIDWDYYLTA